MTEAEIDAAVAVDPDWAEFETVDWSQAEVVVPPKKQAISIRLDQDLIDYFKAQGPGYQRRINAVLRSYEAAQAGLSAASPTRPAAAL
ncbi:BrnA antitoxin family protein [Methylocystis sp.]|uniref:BrnA antitoxin family protein n=1 Tax=Methylocystis sp. TaxID=1911079 RepID=UPI003DA37EF8